MRTLLFAAAAAVTAAVAVPANAEHRDGRLTGRATATTFGDVRCDFGNRFGDFDRRDDRGRRGHRRGGAFCGGFVPYYGGEWALYNNRSWEPDSFNGWWHDRPDRAYPRWVNEARRTGTCDPDRMWWSGSGWHC